MIKTKISKRIIVELDQEAVIGAIAYTANNDPGLSEEQKKAFGAVLKIKPENIKLDGTADIDGNLDNITANITLIQDDE